MTLNTILSAIFIAASYALWPLLGKRSGASAQWLTTIVVVATVIPVAALSFKTLLSTPINSSKAFYWLLAAGLVNGLAVYVYGVKLSSKSVPTGTFVTVVSILFLVFVPIVNWCISRKTITPRQMVGILVAVVAVYLLNGVDTPRTETPPPPIELEPL